MHLLRQPVQEHTQQQLGLSLVDTMLRVAKMLSHMLNHVWGRSSQKLGKLGLELTTATKNSALPVAVVVLGGGGV